LEIIHKQVNAKWDFLDNVTCIYFIFTYILKMIMT